MGSYLAQVEFAYNNSTNQTIRKCHFEMTYGTQPHCPLNLTPSSDKRQYSAYAEKEINKLHEHVRQLIIKKKPIMVVIVILQITNQFIMT